MFLLMFWLLIFAVSLFVLIKASDYFTNSAEKIGLYFGMPPFIIGVTIVAIGTSLPELISSLVAITKNSPEIVIGNIIGSNTANILLIIGVAAVVSKRTIKIAYELIHVDLPLLVGSTFLFTLGIWDRFFTLGEALLCLAVFVVYLLYTIGTENQDAEIKKETKEITEMINRKLEKRTIFTLIVSGIFIYFGAEYTIEAVINLSEILKVGKDLIAVSAVALGTSLPELTITIVATKKGKPEIAIGNVLGSNIFNTLVVIGIPALITPLVISSSIITFSLPAMVIVTLLYFFITQDKQITKWEGWLLIIFYIFFIGKIFNLL